MKILLCIIIFAVKEITCLEVDDDEERSSESSPSSPHHHDSQSSKFKSSWREDDDDDDNDFDIEVTHNDKEENEDDTTKSKRNSYSEDLVEDGESHLSIPKAAALQSGPQSISLGELNSLSRGQVFQGGLNAPRDLSCGMCSRERNLCQIISGIFTRSPLPYGYSVVTPIPVGVCNVTIVEIQKSKNFFALRKKDGTYALNGDWEIQASGTYPIAGTDFTYSASDGTSGEKLEAPGPILEAIDLMLIYQTKNPGIKYEYRVPLPELVGQQPSARILPVVPNIGTGSFNIESTLQNQKTFQNIYNGARRHNNHPAGAQSAVAQPLIPQRSPFTNPSSSQNAGFPQRPAGTVDNTGQISGIANWNNQYLPVRSPGVENPGRSTGVNSPPSGTGIISQGFGSVTNQRFPTHVSSSGSNLFMSNVGTRSSDPRFSGERFPGVLNTDPRSISNRAVSEESKFIGSGHSFQSNLSISHNPTIFKTPGISYTPGTVSQSTSTGNSGTIAGSTNSIHRTRHNHGPRNIQPGPAVGGIGLSPVASDQDSNSSLESDNTRLYFPNDGETQDHGQNRDNQRRRKKKNKKKKTKKQKNRFHWVFKGLTECSKPCGGGNQTSTFSCERRRKGKVVANKFCDDQPLLDHKIFSCNLKPCPAKWVPGEWSTCTKTCGIGVQTREIHCKQEVSPTLTMMVPEGACVESKSDITTKECYLSDCPSSDPLWKVSGWSECSVTCGLGTRTRDVLCTASGTTRDDIMCSHTGDKPANEEPCDMGSCVKQSVWLYSSWSEKCTDACENGIQTRRVTCLNPEQDLDSSCPITSKPDISKFCADSSECIPQWFAGPWSTCSVSCGSGLETRIIKCLSFKSDVWDIVSEKQCIEENKPSDVRECFLDSCLPVWYISGWGECSSTCEGGVSHRKVKCLDSSQKVSAECIGDKPSETSKCNELIRCPPLKEADSKGLAKANMIPEQFNKSTLNEQWKEVDGETQKNTGFRESPIDPTSNIFSIELTKQDSNSEDNINEFKPKAEDDFNFKHKDYSFSNDHLNKTNNTITKSVETIASSMKNKQHSHHEIFDYSNVNKITDKEVDITQEDTEPDDHNTFYDDNQQTNELEVLVETGSALNVIPDKDAQGDESISSLQEEAEQIDQDEIKHIEYKKNKEINSSDEASDTKSIEETTDVDVNFENKKKKNGKGKKHKNPKKEEKKKVLTPGPSLTKANKQHVCVDRIKNCHLVFRARLCRLKYYNKLCCNTCKS